MDSNLNKNKRVLALMSIAISLIFFISGSFIILNPGGTEKNKKARGANDVYTKSLLHFNGSDGSTSFLDSSLPSPIWTASGGAQISTNSYKFGGASGHFTASTTSIISTPDSPAYSLGNNDFTIDFLVKRDSLSDSTNLMHVMGQAASAGTATVTSFRFSFQTSTNNHIGNFVLSDGSVNYKILSTTTQFTDLNRWYHVAITRYNNNLTIYVDGIAEDTVDVTGFIVNDSAGKLVLGRAGEYVNALRNFDGYIDEFRFTNGLARWTSNFTPPTAEYQVLNNIPSATNPNNITQATNGSGEITFNTTISDFDNENTKLKIEYSDNDGPWTSLPLTSVELSGGGSLPFNNTNEYQIDPISTSGGDVELIIKWDSQSLPEFSGLDKTNIKIRLTPNDSFDDGTPTISNTFEINNQPPTTTINNKPDESTISTNAIFTFESNDPNTTFECKIENTGVFLACTSPKEYESLALGNHNFFVKSTDEFGNTEITPQTYSWKIILPRTQESTPSYSPSKIQKEETSSPAISNVVTPLGDIIESEGIKLIFPPNVVTSNTVLEINKIDLPPQLFDKKIFVLGANIIPREQKTNNLVKNLSGTVEIIFYYSEENVLNLEEFSLKIYYFDEITKSYFELPSIIDTSKNTVTGKTTHFSNFVLWGEKKEITPTQITEEIKQEINSPQSSDSQNIIQPIYQVVQPVEKPEEQQADIKKEGEEADLPIKTIENTREIYYNKDTEAGKMILAILLTILIIIMGFIAYELYELKKQLEKYIQTISAKNDGVKKEEILLTEKITYLEDGNKIY